jgi:hypothetical protein
MCVSIYIYIYSNSKMQKIFIHSTGFTIHSIYLKVQNILSNIAKRSIVKILGIHFFCIVVIIMFLQLIYTGRMVFAYHMTLAKKRISDF